MKQNLLLSIYKRLHKEFGPQYWWPGETPFEVIIGAILTQNTNWRNVEKAIKNLKKQKYLKPLSLKKISKRKLAALIRPAGYYNIKTDRLKEFIKFLYKEYDGKISKMGKEKLPILRSKLLSVKGIGPETADSILLYALNKPIFVIDAYTKRVITRHKILNHDSSYHELQDLFMDNLKHNTKLFNEYHALLVKIGKDYCRPKPNCTNCPLKGI